MKSVVVYQVVRRVTLKWGPAAMMFPLANFNTEFDAKAAAEMLDKEPLPPGVTDREHIVEPLELSFFESVEEFEEVR